MAYIYKGLYKSKKLIDIPIQQDVENLNDNG